MKIKNELFLAPIHEYTNYPFRELCRYYGAKYSVIPLVSAMGVVSSPNEKYIDLIDCYNIKEEGVQLFGNNPEVIEKASEILINKFNNLKWIDINSGCPSKNVMSSGGGSKLLKKPRVVGEIVNSLRERGLIVSVKMRLGDTEEESFNFVSEINPDFLIVHGRNVKQMYAGESNWNEIKEIKEKVDYEVVGNGDVINKKDGEEKIKKEYCDGVMIGRGAMSNPGCFSNVEINMENKIRILQKYLDILNEKNYTEKITFTRQKAHNILKGFSNSSEVRKEISLARSVDEMSKMCDFYLKEGV